MKPKNLNFIVSNLKTTGKLVTTKLSPKEKKNLLVPRKKQQVITKNKTKQNP